MRLNLSLRGGGGLLGDEIADHFGAFAGEGFFFDLVGVALPVVTLDLFP